MDKTHIIWGFQWLLYCFLHSLLANPHVKEQAKKRLKIGTRAYRIAYNVLAFGHLAILVVFHLRLQSEKIFAINTGTIIMAIILIASGLAIMASCILKYFKQLSGAFEASAISTLYTGGLHGIVRHPLYLGTFLFLLGAFLYWPLMKNALVVGIIIAYTLLGTLLEEKKLVEEFGEAYVAYKRKVPMIIPWPFATRKKKSKAASGSGM